MRATPLSVVSIYIIRCSNSVGVTRGSPTPALPKGREPYPAVY